MTEPLTEYLILSG